MHSSINYILAVIFLMSINVLTSPIPSGEKEIVEGDMVYYRSKSRGVGLRSLGARWTNGIVPYQISSLFTTAEQNVIIGAMRTIESATAVNNIACVRFRPRIASDPYYINIINGTGCSSTVGQNTGADISRDVTLQKGGCVYQGIIIHELVHALGFLHEQSRPDRDNYVIINWQNIKPGMERNFNKYTTDVLDTLNTPYDYGSIMHYVSTEFSVNGLPTIQAKQANVQIGQRINLSPTDIQEIQMYYNCAVNRFTTTTTTTTTTGLLNPGRWSTTGALASVRFYHRSTVLLDGRVITVGGNGATNGVELYSPTTGRWSMAQPMNDARMSHTVNLLPDGRLFVTGGYYYNQYVKTAEIYNPTTNTWTRVSSMNTARLGHEAVYLPAPWNKILVMGGYTTNAVSLQSCELYDFTTNTWTFTTPMNKKRTYFTATYLPSLGKVVVIGGGFSSRDAEMFTVSTSQWTLSVNTMQVDQYSHTATLLPNGQVLVVGGDNSADNNIYLFNPTTNSFTSAARIGQGRRESSATLLPSGLVLVTGGFSSTLTTVSSAEVYDYRVNTWRSVASMITARAGHTSVLLNNSPSPLVLIIAGQIKYSVPGSSCELFSVNG